MRYLCFFLFSLLFMDNLPFRWKTPSIIKVVFPKTEDFLFWSLTTWKLSITDLEVEFCWWCNPPTDFSGLDRSQSRRNDARPTDVKRWEPCEELTRYMYCHMQNKFLSFFLSFRHLRTRAAIPHGQSPAMSAIKSGRLGIKSKHFNWVCWQIQVCD